jgi:hypothetical protein
VARLADPKVLNAPPIDYWDIITTGDLEGILSRVGISHPPMHLYSAKELQGLFSSCDMVEVAGSNVVSMENSPIFEAAAKDPAAWETFIRLERELNRVPGLVDTGSHIMMALRRQH